MVYVKWTPKLRKYIIKQVQLGITQVQLGITPITLIAKNRRVPRRTVYYLLEKFKQGGLEALEPRPKGRKREDLNPLFAKLVIEEFDKHRIGSHKMWLRLKNMGFKVSERKIQVVYNTNNLRLNKRSRPSQIKFVKYERSSPNELWYCDWATDPRTGQQLIAFIDDCTRVLIHAEIFAHSTTENTILAFLNAISRYGRPKAILTDNGTQFTPARSETGPFSRWCEGQGIKHILGRVHHPQTNGKIERWFGTYKQEYDERFSCLNDYIAYYNQVRIHQGIGYLTPKEKWDKLQSVQIK